MGVYVNKLTYIILVCLLTSCSSVYFSTMEKFGYAKRDLLVKRVVAAKDGQIEAKEQFQSSLEKLSALVNFKGGTLEKKYLETKAEYDASENKAKDVSKKIDAIENVAEALFSEWEDEIDQYSNKNLKEKSKVKLEKTKTKYQPLIVAMRRAERKMDPVLDTLRDQMLYLKHNLNAEAVASIKDELVVIKADVNSLINDMNISINEAEKFVETLN